MLASGREHAVWVLFIRFRAGLHLENFALVDNELSILASVDPKAI